MIPVPAEIPRVVRPAEPDDARRCSAEDGNAEPGARLGATGSNSPAPASPRANAQPDPASRPPSSAELEFMNAMQEYKKTSGRMFPTWSEVLEVLKSLGYEKPSEPDRSAPV